jgi:glycosyltransferase involved in cell wall biosynthesis
MTDPMHVQLSVEAISPVLTGIGRYVWELAQGLPNANNVRGVALHRGGRWLKSVEDCLAEYRNDRPRWPRWIRQVQSKWYSGNREWDMKNSVFHGPNYFLPDRIDTGVITVHDLSVFRFPEMHPIDRVRDFEHRFESSLKKASHVITDSEAIRQELLGDWGLDADHVTAVYLAATASTLSQHGLIHDSYTLCVATLEPRKKVDILMKAYEALPHDLRAQYPLVLVGHSGWHSEGLLKQIERAKDRGWLKYLGYVQETDLPLLYAGARMFAYLSTYEGFGLPLVEAMSSGVPVLTSDQSCMPEVCAGAALLVNPADVTAVQAGLARALEDTQWREDASTLGLKVANGYSWDTCVSQTAAVYQRVLANR